MVHPQVPKVHKDDEKNATDGKYLPRVLTKIIIKENTGCLPEYQKYEESYSRDSDRKTQHTFLSNHIYRYIIRACINAKAQATP